MKSDIVKKQKSLKNVNMVSSAESLNQKFNNIDSVQQIIPG